MKIESILVPTDFSETANHAVEQSLELAIRTGADLHLFHVLEAHHSEVTGVVSALADYLEKLAHDAEQSLALKVDVLRGNGVNVFYETSTGGSPLSGITKKITELDPDLVVMGTHGRTGIAHLLLGSVAEKVLRHTPVNLLTLNKKAPLVRAAHCFERILVPVDFSEFAKRAVQLASSLLAPGGELRVAHVVASPIHPAFYASGVTRLFQLDPDLPERIGTHLASFLEGLELTDVTVREGDVFAELMDVSKQLIVMGTQGLTGLDHLLVGSVSEKMVRVSEIPVLTVH